MKYLMKVNDIGSADMEHQDSSVNISVRDKETSKMCEDGGLAICVYMKITLGKASNLKVLILEWNENRLG